MKSKSVTLFNLDEYRREQFQDKSNKEYVLSRPMEIGHFSVSRDRIYSCDSSELKFLVMPDKNSFPLDLNKQSVRQREVDFYPEYLDNMLHFINDNKEFMLQRISYRKIKVKGDIITDRELLQTLKCTLYTNRSWRIYSTHFQGTFYLCLAKPNVEESSGMQRTCHILETKLKRLLYSGEIILERTQTYNIIII